MIVKAFNKQPRRVAARGKFRAGGDFSIGSDTKFSPTGGCAKQDFRAGGRKLYIFLTSMWGCGEDGSRGTWVEGRVCLCIRWV